jgi:hypothetical protein
MKQVEMGFSASISWQGAEKSILARIGLQTGRINFHGPINKNRIL